MSDQIDLQSKTTALPGTVSTYWFENPNIGLKKTHFHRIEIPLQPFDSGLDYEPQPVSTEITFEWYALGLDDPQALDGLNLRSVDYPDSEASVYIGSAHNWCDVEKLLFRKIDTGRFEVDVDLMVDFEHEGVASNERFKFSTTVIYKPEE